MTPESFRVILSTDDYAKYPFLPEAARHLKELGLTVEELANTPLGAMILGKAKERLAKVIESGTHPSPEDDYRTEIATFYATLLILAGIGDQQLIEKFVTVYSKNVYFFLRQELEKGELAKLIYIAQSSLRWRVRPTSDAVLVYFGDYIQAQPEYVGSWKLVNRLLDRGYVYVQWHEFARLLETGVKRYVATLIRNAEISGSFPEGVYKVMEELSRVWSSRQEDLKIAARTVYSEKKEGLLPPCIRELIRKQSAGENLTHSARFALASFLLSIGLSVDEVLDIFRSSPDFREDIARYQVEHIAGLRGSRVRYSPYKCDNMRSLGLCRWACERVSHPLQYFYRAARGRTPAVKNLW